MLRDVAAGLPFDQARDRAVAELPEVDRRLAHELAAGVLRHRHELDARLEPLVHRGWSSVGSDLRDILRLGVYQLSLLDRIPPHAAVSTTVDLAREVQGETGARFANAILRGVGGRAAAPAALLDPVRALAEEYSHPEWIVRRWLARFGPEATTGLLAWNNTRPRLAIQPARESLEALQQHCFEQGVPARRAPYDAGLIVEGRPTDLPGFQQGDFVVQDPAQALVARFVDPPSGALVYDACAAPGGKTIALGRVAGRVVAGEFRRERVPRLRENLSRAGSEREFVIQATATAPPLRPIEVVLLDVPCLGTGTLGRHPDARWRIGPDGLQRLVAAQAALLEGAASVVRPGGWLVYATCSLEPEENEEQVDHFLERHPEFGRDPGDAVPATLRTAAGDLQLLPHRDGLDGAFASRLRRKS
jgi:16S rRNA (cytosine967-C5)-methyltransferase